MNRKPNEMTIEGMKKIIKKSGYLLEIDVADTLRKADWLVFSQYPYRDLNENKTRLVDILAMKHATKKWGVMLLIECKKATHHGWAFSTIGKPRIGKYFVEPQAAFARLGYLFREVFNIIDFSAIKSLDIKGFHPADIKTKMGSSCCIPPKHPDDFHEALEQVLNSMRWLPDMMTTKVTFPVIVFDGPMWGFYKKGGELKVEEVEYLQYLSAEFNEKMAGPVLIDVIKLSFLPHFLKLVDRSIEWIKENQKVKKE